ncbi:hypothetical protein BN1088_1431791 [Sphingobacterium sp. PM2-P1-29]|nr:hypothetical protein BN1088_1431791 [Sphingobacterium sp. PM2-P1-29]
MIKVKIDFAVHAVYNSMHSNFLLILFYLKSIYICLYEGIGRRRQ